MRMLAKKCPVFLVALLFLPLNSGYSQDASPVLTDAAASNIFLVTIDGLRWQEVFRGLDESLAANDDYAERSETIIARYGAPKREDSAAALMPFLHNTVFLHGTVVGNRDAQSCHQFLVLFLPGLQ